MICGIDEAGRGPLAGPVVAAAVVLGPEGETIEGLADSKTLTARRREALAALIRSRALAWAVVSADVAEIEALNILGATLAAMARAHAELVRRGIEMTTVVIDGTQLPPPIAEWGEQTRTPVRAQPKADAQITAVSAASILAKTARDAYMVALDARYPGYGFARHKGYGTAEHLDALTRLGPCPEHRLSFAPIKQCSLFR
ncbi:MAG: ribonuclease HII [Casimicrobiaceae bacterium]